MEVAFHGTCIHLSVNTYAIIFAFSLHFLPFDIYWVHIYMLAAILGEFFLQTKLLKPLLPVTSGMFSNTTDLCQPGVLGSLGNLSGADCTPHAAKENHEVLLVMFIAQVLLGVGGVPIQPFGISYIDDFASERNSPLYLGKAGGVVGRGETRITHL